MSRRTQPVLALAVAAQVAVVALAACGTANQPQAQQNPTFSTDVSGTPGMSPRPGAPGMSGMPMTSPAQGGGESAHAPAPVGDDAVDIDGFAFIPATLTVKAGTTVTWTNKDEDPHTVVSDGGAFRSQALGSGGTYSFAFPAAGTFDYVCSIHPFMHGSVVVTL